MDDTIELKQVKLNGKHPIMNNPHKRSMEEVQELLDQARKIVTSIGVQMMALQTMLNQPKS